jgi:hypothetical protein
MRRMLWGLTAFGLVLVGLAGPARAGPIITVDENGVGSLDFRPNGGFFPLVGMLQPDPGPGGLPAVLTYNLLGPPALVAGDVLLIDPDTRTFLDVVRFNPAGTGGNPAYPASLVFYSDDIDGFDSLGDTSSPPSAFYTNLVRIDEVGDEINNGAVYTPGPADPGFVPGFSVTYVLISDGSGPLAAPEPASLVLLSLGGLCLVGVRTWHRRRRLLEATA